LWKILVKSKEEDHEYARWWYYMIPQFKKMFEFYRLKRLIKTKIIYKPCCFFINYWATNHDRKWNHP